jgi:hypothetical protein
LTRPRPASQALEDLACDPADRVLHLCWDFLDEHGERVDDVCAEERVGQVEGCDEEGEELRGGVP